jgi:hypothetical protein
MSYFNSAFQKAFVGTDGYTGLAGGRLGTAGNILATGQFAFVNPTTWNVQSTTFTGEACPLVLAAGSLYQNDKIGPFHGGYLESNKSKMINPKYISRFYRVDPCDPQAAQITVGANNTSYEDTTCSKEFFCGETYYLRLDIKGSPVLRTLSRNSYYTADAYTGCCPDGAIAPVAVNPLIVYANWANNFLRSPLISPFVNIQITSKCCSCRQWCNCTCWCIYFIGTSCSILKWCNTLARKCSTCRYLGWFDYQRWIY